MKTPSAYAMEQAVSALLAVRKRLLEEDPDIAQDEKLFADMLEGESGDAMGTLHAMLRAAQYAKDMAAAADTRASEITNRRDRFKRRSEMLRGAAFAAMDVLDLKRVELPELTASIAAGRPGVIVTDMDALPDSMFRIKREIDKTAIGEALKAGEIVPGAELSNSLPSLRITTR